MTPTVLVHPDEQSLATTVAARLLTTLVEAQSERGSASVVLTGGGVGIAALKAVGASPRRGDVDWRRVDLWWGDERYLSGQSAERNDVQARAALLDLLDLDEGRVHPMGALDGPDGHDVDAAAARYAEELALAAPHATGVPIFDVVLLGMGEEGHTASIFPESPAAYDERFVAGVHGCPKPPPTRITMCFPALSSAREVWVMAAGRQKAQSIAVGLAGAGRVQHPVNGAVGRIQTLWFLDEAAASQLPASLRRL